MITSSQIQSLGAQLGILTELPLSLDDLDQYCSVHDLVLEPEGEVWQVYCEDRVVARAEG